MVEKTIDVFAVEEMFDEGVLCYRLASEGLFDISGQVSAVIRAFVKQVQSETVSGVDLVQFWMEAVRSCAARGCQKREFPAIAGDLPVFPEVVEFMGVDDPDVRRTALKVYAVLDPRYRYPY